MFYYCFSSKIYYKKILRRYIIMIFKYLKPHPERGDPDTHSVIDVKHKVKLLMNLTFHFILSYIANTNKYVKIWKFLDNL